MLWIIDHGFTGVEARKLIIHSRNQLNQSARVAASKYRCNGSLRLFPLHRFASVILKTDLAKLNDASRVVRDGRMPGEFENKIL